MNNQAETTIKEAKKAAGTRKRAEGTAVKNALTAAGYTVIRVGHGTGTASGWLDVDVQASKPASCQCAGLFLRDGGWICNSCGTRRSEVRTSVTALVQGVTGRSGQYHGNIQTSVSLTS
jgi:hypothetical protein